MKYLVTLIDDRKFEVTASSINQAADLATRILNKASVNTKADIIKPKELNDWWTGITQEKEYTRWDTVIFKIKPAGWKR